MLRTSILAALIYLLGLGGLAIWSIHGFFSGAPRDEWALMIVLPLAWALSYWPMLGTLILIARIRGLQRTFEEIAAKLDAGSTPGVENLSELEDFATALAAREHRLPEFVVRPVIRKALHHAVQEGSLKRIMDKVRERARA